MEEVWRGDPPYGIRHRGTTVPYHRHHLVARSKRIAVSTMRRQEGRSDARRNAELSPRLSGLRSLSIVRSQDRRGRPLARRQSTGRRSVDARSTHEWSSEAASRAICPNSLRRRCCISEETGGLIGLCPYRYVSNVCSIWDAKDTAQAPLVKSIKTLSRRFCHTPCVRAIQEHLKNIDIVKPELGNQ